MKGILFFVLSLLLFSMDMYGQTTFYLNTSGISNLLWPFGANCSWSNRYETYNGTNAQWAVTFGSTAHNGADVYADDWNWSSSGNADEGQELYACGSGTVIFINNTAGTASTCGNSFGRQIIIRFTGSNFAVRYAHLQSVDSGLTVGSTVVAGQYVGRLGKTGLTGVSTCTAHLHIVLYKNITTGSTALTNLQSGSMPPSSCAAAFYLDATSSGSSASPNDDPCNATTITVGSTCSTTTGTTVGATNTSIPGAPTSCTFYGPDVWFKFQIPSTGVTTVRTTAGTMTNATMAIYSGTICSSLSGIVCEDDNSNGNGSAMPVITITGTPGNWKYIRIWRYGGGTGTFSLCVLNYSIVNKTVDIEGYNLENSLQVTPNPASDVANINYNIVEDSNVTLVIYDLQGKLVSSFDNQHLSAGSYTQSLETADLASGTYLARLTTQQGTTTQKFSVIK